MPCGWEGNWPRVTNRRAQAAENWQERSTRYVWPVIAFRGRKVKYFPGGEKCWRRTACEFYRGINVQWTISVIWPPSWKLWVAVQATTYRGRGHIVSAPSQTDSLLMYRCRNSQRSRRPSRPRLQQAHECRSFGRSLRSSAASRNTGAIPWKNSSSSDTRRTWTRTKWVAICSASLRTCSGRARTNAGSCYRDSRTSVPRSAARSKNCETAMPL